MWSCEETLVSPNPTKCERLRATWGRDPMSETGSVFRILFSFGVTYRLQMLVCFVKILKFLATKKILIGLPEMPF